MESTEITNSDTEAIHSERPVPEEHAFLTKLVESEHQTKSAEISNNQNAETNQSNKIEEQGEVAHEVKLEEISAVNSNTPNEVIQKQIEQKIADLPPELPTDSVIEQGKNDLVEEEMLTAATSPVATSMTAINESNPLQEELIEEKLPLSTIQIEEQNEMKEFILNQHKNEENEVENYSTNEQETTLNQKHKQETENVSIETASSTHDNRLPNKMLFENVRYYLINIDSAHSKETIERLLESSGAQQDKYLSNLITHVICDYPVDNPDYFEAREVFDLKVVRSDWVLKSVQVNCLLPIEAFAHGAESNLFEKVNAMNVNMPETLSKQVNALITFYNGELTTNPCNCTHAFSIEYDSATKQIEQETNGSIKLCTPQWLIDSINAGKLVEETEYHPKLLLNNPDNQHYIELTKKLKEQKRIRDEEEEMQRTVMNSECEANKNATGNQKKGSILDDEKTQIILTDFLAEETKSLNRIIQQANDRIEHQNSQTSLNQTTPEKPLDDSNSTTPTINDIQQQQLQLSQTPSKQPKNKRVKKQSPNEVPTNTATATASSIDLDDIFDSVISASEQSEKQNSVIINQIPHTNLNVNQFQINTNGTYSDQTKNLMPIYLNLIKPPATNFLIDEESQDSTFYVQENSRFINFDCCLLGCVFYLRPSETYYTLECLNDWQKVIEKFGGRVTNEYNQEVTHVLCPDRFSDVYKQALADKKRLVTAYWLEDVLQEQKVRTPWLAYHFPSPYELKKGPLTNHVIAVHGFDQKEKLIIKTLIWLMNGKYSSYLSNVNSFLISKNSEGLKVEKAKQWNINIVNAVWLSELYLGNTLALSKPINERYTNLNVSQFVYDSMFVQDFMDQWKQLIKLPMERIKEAAPLKQLNGSSTLKRHIRSMSPTNNHGLNEKHPRMNDEINWLKPQSNIPIVLFTGIDQNEVQQYQRDVIGLGGVLAKQINQATHLIVDKIERTAKLLKCISTCEYIVHVKWLFDSKMQGKFLDPLGYQVKDERFEKHYNCCLKESLERAKERKPIFNGFFFYLSPSVRPSYADLEEMVRSAGGIVVRDVPTLQQFHEPFLDDRKTGLTSRYVVIGSQNDLCILKPFVERKIRKLFNIQSLTCSYLLYSYNFFLAIYHEELVLSGLLRQKFESSIYKLHPH
jgi:hypothetical protein